MSTAWSPAEGFCRYDESVLLNMFLGSQQFHSKPRPSTPSTIVAAAKGAQLLALALEMCSPRPEKQHPTESEFIFNEGNAGDNESRVSASTSKD
jgi:hypothetical protein